MGFEITDFRPLEKVKIPCQSAAAVNGKAREGRKPAENLSKTTKNNKNPQKLRDPAPT